MCIQRDTFGHEQLDPDEIQDHELVILSLCPEATWFTAEAASRYEPGQKKVRGTFFPAIGCIDGLKTVRDQAKADAERAQAMFQHSGKKAVTPQMLRKFASTACQRIRLKGGGYRRDYLRALAQRVEVDTGEVRIMGSRSRLLQTLVAGDGVNSMPTQGLKWRRGRA
ncbi:hypothetical protein [Paracoccus onubensis]|uniref:hypothetical protein n=1 Tax=Paracoccus onubensis TaxID=1675788 RepID=UPI001C717E19|nr:hypothetical protein [Paracoccus onubensis]